MTAKQQSSTRRDPSTGTVRRRVRTQFTGSTLTEQHHKPTVDINNIMARYIKTGALDHVRQYEGQYADLPPGDYHDSMNKITDAQTMFEELPSQLRKHFANDTAEFLKFCVTHEDPGGELSRIAKEHRQAALGIPPAKESETPEPKAGKGKGSGDSDAGQGSPASEGAPSGDK